MNDQYEVRIGYYGGFMAGQGASMSMGHMGLNGLMQQGINQQTYQNQLAAVQQFNGQTYGLQPNMFIKPTNKRGIMKAFKDYLSEHKDLIFTLLIVLLVDHFCFQDAFKEKIKAAMNKLLDRAHDKIGA